ncbi:hypothetical protein TWF106_009813 [Orbilia oligospora]|uniref:Rhodopsin domain-containing protein n=1 Tax=Orbilia oligospora TaxID=2813651 RepID=A0A6G1MEJ4_ORBOL|nr:hypothetical protein TWF788_010144 [Orbilia oligospora]KAF3212443.1 hypothetical protein TWF106_009813 [Orbilia oligospora]KAF3254448.1 hypothetical protein TWF192_003209 [Orbilia oligospora]
MAGPLTQSDIFYITLTCYYWGSSSPLFTHEHTSEAVKALAQLYIDYPNITDDQVASYYGWDNKTYDVMAMNFAPFNETAFAAELLPLAPHPRATGSVLPLFIIFTILSTVVMALRLWSRWSLLGRIQNFDWAALLSYFLIVAWGAYSAHTSLVGGNMASWCDRSYFQIKQQSIAYNIGMTTYPMVVLSIKLALLIFYYQLSTWRALRTAVLVTGFISIGNALGGFFAFLFQCTKVNFWDSEFDLTLRCEVHTLKAILGTGIVNIITDALVWVIPMPLVWRLQLYTRERIIAFFTFGLGGIACVAAAVRLEAVQNSIRFGIDGKDSILPIIAWGVAPALRALLRKHTPKLLSYGSSGASDIKSMFKRTGGNNSGSAGTRIRSTAGKTHIHVHSDPQSPESHQSPHGKNMSTASIRIGYVDHEKRDSTGTEVELPIQHPPKAAKMDEFV